MSLGRVLVTGAVALSCLALANEANAACGGVGRRIMKGKPGDTFLAAGGAAKNITYRWASTDLPDGGDCGIYARSVTPGVQVRCSYGCTSVVWSTQEGVGPAIADDSEHEWTFQVRATAGAAATAGVVELYVNRGCDVCPPDFRLIGTTNVYVGALADTTFTATAPSTSYSFAINHAYANNNPNARILVTPRSDGPNNDHVVSVWYSWTTGRWNIYNADIQPMTNGARFTVHVDANGSQALLHTSTAANISSTVTFVDHPLSNANPYAQVLATANYNPGGTHNERLGVYYSATRQKWGVYNEDGSSMPVGKTFNVMVIGYPDIYTSLRVNDAWLGTSTRPPIVTHVFNPPGAPGRYYNHNFGITFYDDILPVWSILELDGVGYPDDDTWFNAWHPAAVH